MSKLSQLKQEAYQAGKKRDWERAIVLYEQILEKDKSTPTVINELGDLCLKSGDEMRAVRHFLAAAAKYRATGLLNNAVAIYKKILRYDATNLNAHWYLAETRAGQGLPAEGEVHALRFLENSNQVGGDIKEIFLKRCVQLFELLPESRDVQQRLIPTFRAWDMHLEAARAQCLVATVVHDAGDEDAAAALVEEASGRSPEVCNYPEYQKWNLLVNPDQAFAATTEFSDFGSVDLSADDGPAAPVEPATGSETPQAQVPAASASGEGAVEPAGAEDRNAIMAQADPANEERDNDGCFSIGDVDDGGLEDLVAQAAGKPEAELPDAEEFSRPAAPPVTTPGDGDGLFDQLLSDEPEAQTSDGTSELATITSEIGSVVGGGEEDAAGLYEMGMVYLEMGLFDQACDSFETAAADNDYAVRAHEMWGIALQRANRLEEAVRVFNEGLEFAEEGSKELHGLLYHLGRTHEQAGEDESAVVCYRAIKDVDPTYLDVNKRLKRIVSV